MSNERPAGSTADSSDEPSGTLNLPRWVAVVGLLVVSLPLLVMSSMMLVMGWTGPPMQGPMAGPDPGVFLVAGFVPLLLGLGGMYGAYRLSTADTE